MDKLILNPDYIITYTQKQMSPISPSVEDIDIKDIAHCLSYMCRANGHIKNFYSVAQHCISCYKEAVLRGFSERVAFALLLHDGSEAYLADIIRPVKKNISHYIEIEKELQQAVYNRYGIGALTSEEKLLVDEIDNCMLQHEFINLAGRKIYDRDIEIVGQYDFSFRDFKEVEEEYLQIFKKCFKE